MIWLLNLQKANIDGDEVQHYIPRMEWVLDSKSVILQQLNRKQNQSKIIVADANSGVSKTIHTETDPAGLILSPVGMIMIPADGIGLIMVKNFYGCPKRWLEHIYKIDMNGKETLITKDAFDVIKPEFLMFLIS